MRTINLVTAPPTGDAMSYNGLPRIGLTLLLAVPTSLIAAPRNEVIEVRDLYDPNAAAPIHELTREDRAQLLERAEQEGERPSRIDVEHYDLDVAVDPVTGAVEGAVTVTFTSLAPALTSLDLDALDMEIAG